MKPQLFSLLQLRGQWLAKVTDEQSIALLGQDRIAVIRDWENGLLDWQSPNRTYCESAHDIAPNARNYWNSSGISGWRDLLVEGAPVWVRKAEDDGTPSGTIGRSKGVWRIENVVINDEQISFDLKERLGDQKK